MLFGQVQIPLLLPRQIPLICQVSPSFSFPLSSGLGTQPLPHTMCSLSPRFNTIFLVMLSTHSLSKIQSVFLFPGAKFQYWLPILADYLSWPVLHNEMLLLASAVFVSSSCLEPASYLLKSLLSIYCCSLKWPDIEGIMAMKRENNKLFLSLHARA